MNLSKQTSDAIQMLAYCYRVEHELVKVANIAAELGLTKQMALKLANILSQSDLIETVRGPSGGIRLKKETREITLGQIVRQLERPPSQKSVKPQGQLDGFIDDAFEAFLDVLDRHTLADMATKKTKSKSSNTKSSNTKSVKNRSASVRKQTTRKKRAVGAAARAPGHQRVSRI